MRRVITYGTFDTLHYGHIRLLKRTRALGCHLTVAMSSDEFNTAKGKTARFNWDQRKKDLEAVRYVDKIICEESWDQKTVDIDRHKIDIFAIGDDWAGKFDLLKSECEVLYLPRTPDVSITLIRDK